MPTRDAPQPETSHSGILRSAFDTNLAFLAYCLHVTLRARLRPFALGLTLRAVLDKPAALQMLDVHFPTTDGRTQILARHTEPTADHELLLQQLGLTLPPQPPPRIAAELQPTHQIEAAM